MKLMKTEDAVGQVLCHDITQIIRGVTKDAVFRKGHVIQPEDVPVLLSVGKDTVYIWENDETMLHENDAAYILRDICMNENMTATEPKEGKIEWELQEGKKSVVIYLPSDATVLVKNFELNGTAERSQ